MSDILWVISLVIHFRWVFGRFHGFGWSVCISERVWMQSICMNGIRNIHKKSLQTGLVWNCCWGMWILASISGVHVRIQLCHTWYYSTVIHFLSYFYYSITISIKMRLKARALFTFIKHPILLFDYHISHCSVPMVAKCFQSFDLN